jgi:hypothetical protein
MDSNIVLTTITSSALFVLIIQWLKSSRWFPFLQHGQKLASRIASILFATAGSIGVGYVWNPAGRQLILTLPTVWGAVVALWHIANHFATQEIIYQGTINKVSVTSKPMGAPMPVRVDETGAVVIPAKP